MADQRRDDAPYPARQADGLRKSLESLRERLGPPPAGKEEAGEPAGPAPEIDIEVLMKRIRASIHAGRDGAVDFGGDAGPALVSIGPDTSLPRTAVAASPI